MHQIAEYIIAAVFVAQGLQSKTPAVPSLLGALVLINAACAKAPAAAFRLVDRKLHRVLDLFVIAAIIVMATQPVISLDNKTRLTMGVLAFVLAFVWLGSDFSPAVSREQTRAAAVGARVGDGLRQMDAATQRREHVKVAAAAVKARAASAAGPSGSSKAGSSKAGSPRASSSKADAVGRSAGRLAGKGVNLYRNRKAGRPQSNK
jgi:hypothetical protein